MMLQTTNTMKTILLLLPVVSAVNLWLPEVFQSRSGSEQTTNVSIRRTKLPVSVIDALSSLSLEAAERRRAITTLIEIDTTTVTVDPSSTSAASTSASSTGSIEAATSVSQFNSSISNVHESAVDPPTYAGNATTTSANTTASSPAVSQGRFVGFNMVNQKPASSGDIQFKTQDDWADGFDRLLALNLSISAVRMYSTTDIQGDGMIIPHLYNALPVAMQRNISIFAGIWSGGVYAQGRFYQEMWALREVLSTFGCASIAAVSVGNEDLYEVNNIQALETDVDRNLTKTTTANLLVDQITQVQELLDQYNCCDVPVTHTDTFGEWNVDTHPWVLPVVNAVDEFITANIFPYWEKSTLQNSIDLFQQQYNTTLNIAKIYGKDMWLGETGWPSIDQGQNPGQVNTAAAQTYFDQIGCRVLTGAQSGFYYVDWDGDAPANGKPSFGVMDSTGNPLLNLVCKN